MTNRKPVTSNVLAPFLAAVLLAFTPLKSLAETRVFFEDECPSSGRTEALPLVAVALWLVGVGTVGFVEKACDHTGRGHCRWIV